MKVYKSNTYSKVSDYKIIDNFLSETDINILEKTIANENFPWRRRSVTTPQKEYENKDKGFFTYSFFYNYISDGQLFEPLIIPILNKLEAKSVIQVRANMTLKQLFLDKYTSFHVDYKNYNNKTAILNLTDCDGGTALKINDKIVEIKSKKNRMLVFDGDIYHASIKQNETDVRYIINFNFF